MATQTPEDAGELREVSVPTIDWLIDKLAPQNSPLTVFNKNRLKQLIANEQTKLLEKLESELPEQEDYLTAPGSSQEEIDAWNKALDQARSLLAKHKEGLKQ